MTHFTLSVALTVTLFSGSVYAASQDRVTGLWQTVDDKTGEAASIVHIHVADAGELRGTIKTLLRSEDQGKVCDLCPDAFYNQPIEGLTFMWGLQPSQSGAWQGGRILDPESGSIYRSQLTVSDDGQTITVRGYIGVSWLGRSQKWQRVEQGDALHASSD